MKRKLNPFNLLFSSFDSFYKKSSYFFIFTAFFLSIHSPSMANDFHFYSKFGKRSSAWNQDVKAGFDAYAKQDCDTSLEFLKKAVGLQCKDTLVLYKLAVCSEKQESLYTAIQYYELAFQGLKKLRSKHRYQDEIYESYGRALFKARRYSEALPLLTKAVQINNNFSLNYMLGYIHAKENNWSSSNHYLQQALLQDSTGVPSPLLAKVYFQVAKAQAKQKKYSLAMKLLRKAIELDSSHPEQVNWANQKLREWQGMLFQEKQKDMMEGFKEIIGNTKSNSEKNPEILPPPPAADKLPPLE